MLPSSTDGPLYRREISKDSGITVWTLSQSETTRAVQVTHRSLRPQVAHLIRKTSSARGTGTQGTDGRVAHPKNLLAWPISILKGGSLFAFERPEPEGGCPPRFPPFSISQFPFSL